MNKIIKVNKLSSHKIVYLLLFFEGEVHDN